MALAVVHVPSWYEENRGLFDPPVCNKLVHKEQLSVMFVGGPNIRTDFHLDRGSEFFYMLRGNMELPTIQKGKRVNVRINEGEVFLLPSCIPHSPQRPEKGSLGLVVERSRDREAGELDGLRWFTDFEKCDEVVFQRYFHCGDLGKDLVPVVMEYKASPQFSSGVPATNAANTEGGAEAALKESDKPVALRPCPFKIDTETEVPAPFLLSTWIESNRGVLLDSATGSEESLFGSSHPDGEFSITIRGGGQQGFMEGVHYPGNARCETMVYMIRGSASTGVDGSDSRTYMSDSFCCVIPLGKSFTLRCQPGCLVMIVRQDPAGNAERYKNREAFTPGCAVPECEAKPAAKVPRVA